MAGGILAEICRERAEDAARAALERPASSLEREADAPRPCFGMAVARRSDVQREGMDGGSFGERGLIERTLNDGALIDGALIDGDTRSSSGRIVRADTRTSAAPSNCADTRNSSASLGSADTRNSHTPPRMMDTGKASTPIKMGDTRSSSIPKKHGDMRSSPITLDAESIRGDECILIAECKKASPSRGLIVPDYDPVALARAYERGGAGMISVLTEPRHFLGSAAHLAAVRAAVNVPAIRKDFIVAEYQVREAWAIGADAILLIVAALERSRLLELAACARELGLGVLVETRDEKEIETALEVASISPSVAIGVNARDLRDFSVDHGRAASLARLLAETPFPVAESGLKKPGDLAALAVAGYRGFLVGEALASAPDPEAAARAFVSAFSRRDATAKARDDEGPLGGHS